MKICVFLTSSVNIDEHYQLAAATLGKEMAESGHEAIFGGTEYGLMKVFADSYIQHGGKSLIGILAEDLIVVTKNYKIHPHLHQTIRTPDIGTRKSTMITQADAFIALPGGYATLEELSTVIGARINKLINKPIALLNTNEFYKDFLQQLSKIHQESFSKISPTEVLFSSESTKELLTYLEGFHHQELADKFI